MPAGDAPTNPTHLVIRNFDPGLNRALARSAFASGISVEEEARRILAVALADFGEAEASSPVSLGAAMAALFGEEGGIELDIPPRETGRAPPDFGGAGVP